MSEVVRVDLSSAAGRLVLGTFVVMFIIINAAYFFAYGGWFTAIKWTRTATSVACP
jgi:hypothetical protein